MVRLFEVRPDDKSSNSYTIDASHKWGLPGLSCSVCGQTWSTTGVAYPLVDLSALSSEKRYRNVSPVTLDELNKLRNALLPLMPNDSVSPPGTDFGPLTGKARGTFGDFVWPNPWTLLIRSEALDLLNSAGVSTPSPARPSITFRGKDSPDLLEFQLEPYAQVSSGTLLPDALSPCRSCGHNDLCMPEHLVIERSSIPQNLDIFRARDFTTLILATERFMEAVQNLKLTDILFHEVDVK